MFHIRKQYSFLYPKMRFTDFKKARKVSAPTDKKL